VKSFTELYPTLTPGELLAGTSDRRFETSWAMASAKEFRALPRAASPVRLKAAGLSLIPA
jgi:hypothetical protein